MYSQTISLLKAYGMDFKKNIKDQQVQPEYYQNIIQNHSLRERKITQQDLDKQKILAIEEESYIKAIQMQQIPYVQKTSQLIPKQSSSTNLKKLPSFIHTRFRAKQIKTIPQNTISEFITHQNIQQVTEFKEQKQIKSKRRYIPPITTPPLFQDTDNSYWAQKIINDHVEKNFLFESIL